MTPLCVDRTAAREVAASYLDAAADGRDPLTVGAFAVLVSETDHLFRWLTDSNRPTALRVSFTTCENPYRDAQELIAAVSQLRVLEVTTVAGNPDRHHPLMSNDMGGELDRLRAVHDTLGHGRLHLGFDRDGEYTVWRVQERFHSPLARRALSTELHGQHSVRWTTGEIAEPKAVLLDEGLLARSRAGATYTTPGVPGPST